MSRTSKNNPVQPLCEIVQEYSDKDGDWQALSCGHQVQMKKRVKKRRCPHCEPKEGPPIIPSGPVALREWMVERYGWPDGAVKDVTKLNGWFIDHLDLEKRNLYATDCRLLVTVVDDRSFLLLLLLSNGDLVAQIESDVGGLTRQERGYLISVDRLADLHVIADAIQRVITGPYDAPSFKYVCPNTVGRLREFASELTTYAAPSK